MLPASVDGNSRSQPDEDVLGTDSRGLGGGTYKSQVTIVTGADKHCERVPGNRVTAHSITGVIARASQMAIDTADVSLAVDRMGSISQCITVTAGAQGIGRSRSTGFLSMNFVTVNASHAHLTVTARRPFNQSTRVAGTTQVFGCSDHHTLLGVSFPVGTVAGLTGHPGQHKLTGDRIVTGRMACETLAWFFRLLQINLENRIKRGPSMSGI
jgi:hypothetical protein